MLDKKNVRYVGILKTSKKNLLNPSYFKDTPGQKFVTTILVTHATILTEPDLSF